MSILDSHSPREATQQVMRNDTYLSDKIEDLSNKVHMLELNYQELFKHVVESRNREIELLGIVEKLIGVQNNVS